MYGDQVGTNRPQDMCLQSVIRSLNESGIEARLDKQAQVLLYAIEAYINHCRSKR